MSSLILNGIYDLNLIKALQAPGVLWGMDFRAQSLQFLPFHQFQNFVKSISPLDEVVITFADEKIETIHSFINLFENENIKAKWSLCFRDSKEVSYYQQINSSFSWFFSEQSDWKEMMGLPKLNRIIIPISVATHLPSEFWDLADGRGLEVVLHFNSFQELFSFKNINRDVCISVDLTSEVEHSYRRPNLLLIQTYLRALDDRKKLGELDESIAGQ